MSYCPRCGKQNADDAKFCNKCSAPLMGQRPRKKNNECEDECSSSPKGSNIFWGIIVVVIGLYILFEYGIKQILSRNDMPDWLYDFEFCWIIPLMIGIAIILAGIRVLIKRT